MVAGRLLATVLTSASVLALRVEPARAAVPVSQLVERVDASGFRVSLRLRFAGTSSGHRSALGLLSLTLPLERLAAPAVPPDSRWGESDASNNFSRNMRKPLQFLFCW